MKAKMTEENEMKAKQQRIAVFGCSQQVFAKQWTIKIKQRCASLGFHLFTSAFLGLLVLLVTAQQAQAQWTSNGNNINNTNTGNVGIGTSTPNAKLVVASGNVGLGSNDIETWTQQSSVIESLNTSIFFGQVTDVHIISNAYHNAGWKYKTSGAAANYYLYNGAHGWRVGSSGTADTPITWLEAMTLTNGGNLGIGTTNPSSRLSIVGPVQNGVYTVSIDSTAGGQAGAQHGINITGTSATTYLSAGATSLQGAAPHVNVSAADNTNYAVTFGNTGGFGRVLRLRSSSSSDIPVVQVEGANGSTVALSALSNGSVGVGTASPDSAYKLDVVGNVRVSGNIAAKYQDLAEWVPAAHALPPGTVVTLNRTQSNLVEASSKPYDTGVAGVISAQPGITLGERAENKVLVATTGRVKVKVDATNAPIQIGDLLVTSEQKGIAMKSVPVNLGGVEIHRPGTLIGKALEPLAKGQGEILILLSLQ